MRIWKPCPEFEGLYEVSEDGLVRRCGGAGKGVQIGKVLRPGMSRMYPNVVLRKDGESHSREVHKLICWAFNGKRPSNLYCVAHKDGNSKNNRADNLEWVLYRENSYHQVLHGTSKGLVRDGRRIISDDDVLKIRSDHRSEKKIAPEYGLSPATIGQIRRRETYKHLPPRNGDYVPEKRNRRFSDDDVREIRRDPRRVAEIAEQYGVSHVAIYEIKNRKYYPHVPD